jgi:hypothetical protein
MANTQYGKLAAKTAAFAIALAIALGLSQTVAYSMANSGANNNFVYAQQMKQQQLEAHASLPNPSASEKERAGFPKS